MKKLKSLLVRIEKATLLEYKNICKSQGLNMSQRIRNFIDTEILKFKENK